MFKKAREVASNIGNWLYFVTLETKVFQLKEPPVPLKRSRSETHETVTDTDSANPSTSRVGGHELPSTTDNHKKSVDDTSFDRESRVDFGLNINDNKQSTINHTFLANMDIATAGKTWQR